MKTMAFLSPRTVILPYLIHVQSLIRLYQSKTTLLIMTSIFLALTESWLKPGDVDNIIVDDHCPTVYNFFHHPKQSGRGSGVGLLSRKVSQIKSNEIISFSTFEQQCICYPRRPDV